jgi:hypothetical protein
MNDLEPTEVGAAVEKLRTDAERLGEIVKEAGFKLEVAQAGASALIYTCDQLLAIPGNEAPPELVGIVGEVRDRAYECGRKLKGVGDALGAVAVEDVLSPEWRTP